MGNSSLVDLSGGKLDGDAGGVRTSSADATFLGSTAEGRPTSAVTSSFRAASRRAQVHGGLSTDRDDVATSATRASSADSFSFLFLRNLKIRSVKEQHKFKTNKKGLQSISAYPPLRCTLNVSFNGAVDSCDRATSKGDPMLPMRVSPRAASPSTRATLAPAAPLDNSRAPSAPGSLLPNLEAAAQAPLGRAPLRPALEAEAFRMACLLLCPDADR